MKKEVFTTRFNLLKMLFKKIRLDLVNAFVLGFAVSIFVLIGMLFIQPWKDRRVFLESTDMRTVQYENTMSCVFLLRSELRAVQSHEALSELMNEAFDSGRCRFKELAL